MRLTKLLGGDFGVGTVPLDELDMKLLELLQRDGRMAYTSIADQLGVSEGTVRKRLGRLIREGVVRISAVIDPRSLGISSIAIVGIKVDAQRMEPIVDAIVGMPEVRRLMVSTGTYDLIAEVAVGSNEELFRFLTGKLRRLQGIGVSETSLILKVCKESHEWEGWKGKGEGT